MGPKTKTPISSPVAAEGSAKKKAKGSSANVQLLYTNCEPGGAVFSSVHEGYFSSTVIAEIKKLSVEEKLEVKNEFSKQNTEANSFITEATRHFNYVKKYSTESYDSNYLRELKRPHEPLLNKGLSVTGLIFEQTKLTDYLRIVTEELKIREDAPKRMLLSTFVKLIDEDLKPPEIILESSNEGYEVDDTIYRVAPAAVDSSSGGAFTALVAGSASSSSSSSSNIATAVAEERML